MSESDNSFKDKKGLIILPALRVNVKVYGFGYAY